MGDSSDDWINALNGLAKTIAGGATAFYGVKNQLAQTKAQSELQRTLINRTADLQVAQLNGATSLAGLPANWSNPSNQAPPVIVSGGSGGGLELTPTTMLIAGAVLVLVLLK